MPAYNAERTIEKTWREVLEQTLSSSQAIGWTVAGLERSPILGPAGNVEFLGHLVHEPARGVDLEAAVARVLAEPSIEQA